MENFCQMQRSLKSAVENVKIVVSYLSEKSNQQNVLDHISFSLSLTSQTCPWFYTKPDGPYERRKSYRYIVSFWKKGSVIS